jgi:hypothetical protein
MLGTCCGVLRACFRFILVHINRVLRAARQADWQQQWQAGVSSRWTARGIIASTHQQPAPTAGHRGWVHCVHGHLICSEGELSVGHHSQVAPAHTTSLWTQPLMQESHAWLSELIARSLMGACNTMLTTLTTRVTSVHNGKATRLGVSMLHRLPTQRGGGQGRLLPPPDPHHHQATQNALR